MQRFILLFFLLPFLPISSFAQIEGLWEVQSVFAGDQEMTPQAKWFDFRADFKLLSGNGGVINNRGSWTYNADEASLMFTNAYGEQDPAGAFQLEKDGQSMQWTRQEEGMNVRISLQKIDDIPFASWDLIAGNWEIHQIIENGMLQSVGRNFSMFFRWDHLFVARNDLQGRSQHWGTWQIHSHKPELRLMALNGKEESELWELEKVDTQQLILKRKKEGKTMKLIFDRANE